MDIKVNIDAEAAQQQIVQAIMDSAIGPLIEKEINALLDQKTGGFYGNRIIEEAIKSNIKTCIAKIIKQLIDDKQEEIKAL